ncbi:MAG: hypothetical protein UY96_C0012G0013 [Parcubacteria group bacterium GW2011_GWB1_56_8]|nr:MAG: hypothetical protein UY96_C0012G0013 [Parcubacteria group bacterium GW2011_GWB1_56_8]
MSVVTFGDAELHAQIYGALVGVVWVLSSRRVELDSDLRFECRVGLKLFRVLRRGLQLGDRVAVHDLTAHKVAGMARVRLNNEDIDRTITVLEARLAGHRVKGREINAVRKFVRDLMPLYLAPVSKWLAEGSIREGITI